MGKFKVLAGNHAQGGKTYEAGSVISTDLDLDKMFPNKFEILEGNSPKSNPATLTTSKILDKDPDTNEEGLKVHVNKTEPVTEQPKTEEAKVETKGKRGKLATKQFPLAKDEDFKVYHKDKKYFVYDPDDMTEPISPPLIKAKVEDFIKDYVEANQ